MRNHIISVSNVLLFINDMCNFKKMHEVERKCLNHFLLTETRYPIPIISGWKALFWLIFQSLISKLQDRMIWQRGAGEESCSCMAGKQWDVHGGSGRWMHPSGSACSGSPLLAITYLLTASQLQASNNTISFQKSCSWMHVRYWGTF